MNPITPTALLVLLAFAPVACNNTAAPQQEKPGAAAPQPGAAGQPDAAKNDGPKKEIVYLKNPAPPFEVELGEAAKDAPAAEFLNSGHMRLPLLYREWIFVGSRLVAGSEPTFENYYMHPRHYHALRQNHAWPHQIALVREQYAATAGDTQHTMGKRRGVSAAFYDGRADTAHGGWQFFDFGSGNPPANSAPPDGRAWFDSADALLEFCPVLRGMKR